MIYSASALREQLFLVTGASSGIGRATAILIAQCGGRVVCVGRDEQRLAQTLDQLSGGPHVKISASLADPDEVATLVSDAAAKHGLLDGIFHAAGHELVLPIRLTKRKHLDEVFGAAVYGAIGVAKSAAKATVLKDGGSLVFMSSVAASHGRAGMVLYSSAKAAVEGMVRSLASEFGSRKVRVTAIAAGGVKTEMHQRLTHGLSEAAIAEYERAHLLGFGSPSDVASAAIYLLSPSSSWVTGTVLTIDGGYSAV